MIWLKKETDEVVYNWIKANLKNRDFFENSLTFGIYCDTNIIAGITLSFYGKYNVYLSIYSIDKKWCCRKVINFTYDYCFDVLCFKKITCIADKSNRKIRTLLTRLGFRLEGAVRCGMLNGNTAIFYGLHKNDEARNKFKLKR